MNCNYFEDRLSDYLEDALDPVERPAVELHFQTCAACSVLLQGVQQVMQWGREFPAEPAPQWLATRIVANTPIVVRITWRDWVSMAWRSVSDPRFAMSLLTAVLMIGWMGSVTGLTAADLSMVRTPSTIVDGVEGWANRVYGDAVRNIYSSPLVNSIQRQIHTGIEKFRENS
jgi:predicted anti-sigma-YlaC factor YlaD